MTHSCVEEVLSVMGDLASKKQIQGWVTKLQKIDPEPSTLSTRVQQYGEEALRKAYLKKRNTALLLQKQVAMVDFIKTNFADDPIKGLQAYIGGVQSDKAGTRKSVDNLQEVYKRKYINGITLDLQRNGLFEDFRTGELDDAVAMELEDLSIKKPTGKATKSKKAKEIATILRKHQDYARDKANAAGADIGSLDGYVAAQTHEMFKIRKENKGTWITNVRNKLDMEKTFGDADPATYDDLLAEAYDAFASGQHMKQFGEPILAPIDRTQNIGGTMSKHRMLHFKSAADWIEYNKSYGKGSLRENIWESMTGIAHKTALMDMMGPNPEEALNRVFDDLGSGLTGQARNSLADNRKKIDKLLATVDGNANIPANAMVAKYMQIVRGVQSMAKLGGAVVSAIADVPLAASELKYQGTGYLEGYKHAMMGGFNNLPKQYRREMAMQLGVFLDAQNASMTERLSGKEDFSGKTSKALGTFFKWSGLSPWTDRMRVNMALAMSSRLGMLHKTSWADVEPDLKRTLNLFNIGESDWAHLQKSIEVAEDGTKFMSPEGVMDIPDNVLSLKERTDLSDRLRGYYIDRVDMAVINPDARTMATMKQATQAGTVEGELLRMIGQFKAFPVTIMQKVGGREIHGRGAGGWKTAGGVEGIAHVIAATTAFGYMAMSAKDILKGREPRDPTEASTWASAMLQGGALGLYGDFLLGSSNRYGQSPLQSFAGPTLGSIEEIGEILMAIRDGEDPSAKGFKFLVANTPYANLFYTKAGLDYLILYRIQESLNPGYLRRMERTVEKNNKQEFIIKPSSVIPRGGF